MKSIIETDNKPVLLSKVGEVTEKDGKVLVPQYPVGYDESMDFLKTIVYDLLQLDYDKDEINKIYSNAIQNPESWNPESIETIVEEEGRTIIDREESPDFGKPKFVTKPVKN